MIESKIKYNTDDFFSSVLIKNVSQILFNHLYIQTFVQKKMMAMYSEIWSASCFHYDGFTYVHANFKHISATASSTGRQSKGRQN